MAFKQDVEKDFDDRVSEAFAAVRHSTDRTFALFPKELQSSLPAFGYGSLFMPGAAINLHFFEPRYKAMIRNVMERDRRFLYVYQSPRNPSPTKGNRNTLQNKVGTVVLIDECSFEDDGRANIRGTCGPKVRIGKELQCQDFEGSPLYTMGYEIATDRKGDEACAKVTDAAIRCEIILHKIYRHWNRSELESEVGLPPSAESNAEGFSNWVATWALSNAPETLEVCLQTEDTSQRLSLCESVLSTILDHFQQRLEDKKGTNNDN